MSMSPKRPPLNHHTNIFGVMPLRISSTQYFVRPSRSSSTPDLAVRFSLSSQGSLSGSGSGGLMASLLFGASPSQDLPLSVCVRCNSGEEQVDDHFDDGTVERLPGHDDAVRQQPDKGLEGDAMIDSVP